MLRISRLIAIVVLPILISSCSNRRYGHLTKPWRFKSDHPVENSRRDSGKQKLLYSSVPDSLIISAYEHVEIAHHKTYPKRKVSLMPGPSNVNEPSSRQLFKPFGIAHSLKKLKPNLKEKVKFHKFENSPSKKSIPTQKEEVSGWVYFAIAVLLILFLIGGYELLLFL